MFFSCMLLNCQKVKGDDSAPLLWQDPTCVLCPSLEPSVQKGRDLLERVKRRPQKWSEGWSTPPMRKGWESWGCSAWRREGSTETLLQPSSTHRGACKTVGQWPFTRACSDRRRGNGVKEDRFRLDIGKKFFALSMVRHWNGLPREAVAAFSLTVFKARLDGALRTLV